METKSLVTFNKLQKMFYLFYKMSTNFKAIKCICIFISKHDTETIGETDAMKKSRIRENAQNDIEEDTEKYSMRTAKVSLLRVMIYIYIYIYIFRIHGE